MYKNLAIFASTVLILSPFAAPALAWQASVASSIPSHLESPTILAQSSRERQIVFAPGAASASVSTSIVRGDRAIYLLRADRDQTMTVTIDSTPEQGGALFNVISPSGEILSSGSASFRQTLRQSGDYRIIVSGSRGNPSFNMTISIN